MVRPMPCPPKSRITEKPLRRTSRSTTRSIFRNSKTGSRYQHCLRESLLREFHQPLALFRYFSHGNSHGGIRHETAFLHRNIQLYKIALLQRALARNAMHCFVIDADAVHSGKSIHQRRCRSCFVLAHHSRTHFVPILPW
jgi:hypothetical protein